MHQHNRAPDSAAELLVAILVIVAIVTVVVIVGGIVALTFLTTLSEVVRNPIT